MIHLAYATHNKHGVQVNGHRSRMWAVSEYLDEYNLFSVNGGPPEYNDGDVLIIDSESDDYGHLLSKDVFSVLISDEYGMIQKRYPHDFRWYPINFVWYVSDGVNGVTGNSDYISQMVYTVSKDVKINSWEGDDYVLFLPGSNWNEFWNKAGRFEDYCVENEIVFLYPKDSDDFLPHDILIESARYARCVITASGVTAKEMIYMGVPCILILTADNQLGNYTFFNQRQWAYGQDTDPCILSDKEELEKVSKRIKKVNLAMPTIPHMLDIIRRKHEAYLRN